MLVSILYKDKIVGSVQSQSIVHGYHVWRRLEGADSRQAHCSNTQSYSRSEIDSHGFYSLPPDENTSLTLKCGNQTLIFYDFAELFESSNLQGKRS